jgi:hypothetical protein
MFSKTVQKSMLSLGGLLLLAQNTIPAAQAANWLTEPTTIYIHAATSAKPIIFNHEEEINKISIAVKAIEENAIIKSVEDNFKPSTEDIKNYVKAEAKKAGLSYTEMEIIINCESRWITDAKGTNRNGSYDLGLWQINSIHKNMTDAEKLNYKTATKWAIEKRLRDGNWSAWSCSRKLASR